MILGNSNNYGASKLPVRTENEPREGILNESGSVLDNKRFSIPYIDHGKTGRDHLLTIAHYAQQQGLSTEMKIINGQELPPLTKEVFSKTILTPPEIILGQELNYEAGPFKFKWNRSNLCIAAVPTENESLSARIRQAMLQSLLACVRQHKMFDNIASDIQDVVANFNTKRSLLIIDTPLEAVEMFHPPKQTFAAKKDEIATITPAESLKKLLEEGPPNGSFVVAFVENWKLFSEIYKGYLDLFGFRIGYGLNEKDAGGLVNDSMSSSIKDKGFIDGTKAVFADIKRGKTQLFRPFVAIEE